MLRSLVVWLTFRCKFSCPYCSAGELDQHAGVEATGQQWIKALNSLPPATIDLTGGEPFLHAGIYEIISGLDQKHHLGITTNLSLVEIDRLPQRDKISWTISLHPTQFGKFAFQEFVEKAALLKQKYKEITVNYVATPIQMRELPRYHELFSSGGFRFHVDPDMRHFFTPAEIKFLAPYLLNDRITSAEGSNVACICNAGVEHVHVLPDGTVFRCYYHRRSLGNLFTRYHLCTSAEICSVNCRSGCDLDKVKRYSADGRL